MMIATKLNTKISIRRGGRDCTVATINGAHERDGRAHIMFTHVQMHATCSFPFICLEGRDLAATWLHIYQRRAHALPYRLVSRVSLLLEGPAESCFVGWHQLRLSYELKNKAIWTKFPRQLRIKSLVFLVTVKVSKSILTNRPLSRKTLPTYQLYWLIIAKSFLLKFLLGVW